MTTNRIGTITQMRPTQPHSTGPGRDRKGFSTKSGRTRTLWRGCCAVACAWLGACSAPDVSNAEPDDAAVEPPPAARTPDEVGPYAVGFATLRVPRDALGDLVLEVWYPARPAAEDRADRYEEGFLGLDGAAYRDAPVDPRGAPFPVAAFSHGFGGIRFQSAYLMEFLASHGLVVVAPDHAGSTLLDLAPDEAAAVAVRRPRDISDAVDAVRDGAIDGLDVDASQYAVIGHSFGAWTALAVGGGILDGAAFEAVCEVEDRTACDFFVGQHFNADDAARYATPDPRASVTVALAPGAWYAFSADGSGLSGVRAPLVLGGTRDSDLPFETEAVPTYAALGAPKAFGALLGAGHWGFSNMCDLIPFDDCAGADKGFMEPSRTRAIVTSRVLAHVRLHLLDRVEDAAWLVGADDLEWTSEPSAR